MTMESNHKGCIHHTEHDKSITRNEKDIQDIFDMHAELQKTVMEMSEYFTKSIGKINTQIAIIVTGITALGKLIEFIVKGVSG